MPPTPTPFPPSTPVYVGPNIQLWDFTGPALQIWNTAGQWVVLIQVIILVMLVLIGLSLVLGWLRKFSNEGDSDN